MKLLRQVVRDIYLSDAWPVHYTQKNDPEPRGDDQLCRWPWNPAVSLHGISVPMRA